MLDYARYDSICQAAAVEIKLNCTHLDRHEKKFSPKFILDEMCIGGTGEAIV